MGKAKKKTSARSRSTVAGRIKNLEESAAATNEAIIKLKRENFVMDFMDLSGTFCFWVFFRNYN